MATSQTTTTTVMTTVTVETSSNIPYSYEVLVLFGLTSTSSVFFCCLFCTLCVMLARDRNDDRPVCCCSKCFGRQQASGTSIEAGPATRTSSTSNYTSDVDRQSSRTFPNSHTTRINLAYDEPPPVYDIAINMAKPTHSEKRSSIIPTVLIDNKVKLYEQAISINETTFSFNNSLDSEDSMARHVDKQISYQHSDHQLVSQLNQISPSSSHSYMSNSPTSVSCNVRVECEHGLCIPSVTTLNGFVNENKAFDNNELPSYSSVVCSE